MTKKKKPTKTAKVARASTRANATTRKNTPKKATSAPIATNKPGRTKSGKVPKGRTLSTYDNYLSGGKKTGSTKKRPVVVIEANDRNELAVVPLTSSKGKNRTRLKSYQQGQSYFKHHVETQDDEGKSIIVNQKFKENHPSNDVSRDDVKKIRDKVFQHSAPAPENRMKMEKFREKNKSPRN